VLAGQPADGVQRGDGRVGQGLVEALDDALDVLGELAGAEDDLLVIGPQRLGDRRRLGRLAQVARLVSDRERPNRPDSAREGGDERGVRASAQQHAQRHVGDQPRTHRALEQVERLGNEIRSRHRADGAVGHRRLPVDTLFGLPRVDVDLEHAPGAELANAVDQRRRARDVAEREVGVERVEIEPQRAPDGREQRGELGGEPEPVAVQRVEERLLAEAVAGEQETPALLVQDREGEHPVERVHQVRAKVLVQMDQDLGVAAAGEPVTAAAQALLEDGVVVDLAVEDRPDRGVLVRHRLMAAFDVDDAEPAGGDGDLPGRVDVQPLVVRSAVDETGRHGGRQLVGVHAGRAADAAHRGDLTPTLPGRC
jgi:hypothetical protein